MSASYFNQFNISNILYINISEIYISISNLTIILFLTLIIITNLHKNNNLITNRIFTINKVIYIIAYNLTNEHLNSNHLTHLPLIFNLLILLTTINLIGLLPYTLTATSHIIITFSLSLTILISSTLNSAHTHSSNFLSILTPQGSPLILSPFLVIIETASYLTRAISLGVRLAANISAGHLLLTILSTFSLNILLSNFFLISIFPITILSLILLLEIAVALIQAYVFTLLTTIYLSDSINLH